MTHNLREGVWRQGDFILVNPATKGILILGRRLVLALPSTPNLL